MDSDDDEVPDVKEQVAAKGDKEAVSKAEKVKVTSLGNMDGFY